MSFINNIKDKMRSFARSMRREKTINEMAKIPEMRIIMVKLGDVKDDKMLSEIELATEEEKREYSRLPLELFYRAMCQEFDFDNNQNVKSYLAEYNLISNDMIRELITDSQPKFDKYREIQNSSNIDAGREIPRENNPQVAASIQADAKSFALDYFKKLADLAAQQAALDKLPHS